MGKRQKASGKSAKFLFGAGVLIPLCAVWTAAAWRLGRAALGQAEGWRDPLVLSFCGGTAAACACFALGWKPVRAYLVGHEMTHALWVWAFRGKVIDFWVGREAGYVKTDRVNWWISLAPYFFPIYSVFVLWLWWLASFMLPVQGHAWLLFAVLGATWGFHVCFTVLAMTRFQPDISGEGWVFSISLIYLLNLVPLLLLLVLVSPDVGWGDLGRALVFEGRRLARAAWHAFLWLAGSQ